MEWPFENCSRKYQVPAKSCSTSSSRTQSGTATLFSSLWLGWVMWPCWLPWDLNRSHVWYFQAWPIKSFTNAPPWAFPWHPMGWQHPEQLWEPYVEGSSASESRGPWMTGWKMPNTFLIFPTCHPEFEWENKQETVTKIPLWLNYYILGLFVCTFTYYKLLVKMLC